MKASIENIEAIQNELNEFIVNHTNDTLSLLEVASVLFSSSLKCYGVVLGDDGLIKFMEQSLTTLRKKQKINVH